MDLTNYLTANDIPYIEKSRYFMISCVNPEHDDNNPSMIVYKHDLIGYCFSCGYVHDFSTHTSIGLKRKQREILNKISMYKTASLSIPNDAIPASGIRGISDETIKRFDGFYSKIMPNHIIIPITAHKRIYAFMGRNLDEYSKNRYLSYPDGVTMRLFPYEQNKGVNYIVITEGIFDMLRLVDMGINSSCIFGLNSKNKLKHLKVYGIKHVIFYLDNDAKEKKHQLNKINRLWGDSYNIVFFFSESDPNSASNEELNKLFQLISFYSGDQYESSFIGEQ